MISYSGNGIQFVSFALLVVALAYSRMTCTSKLIESDIVDLDLWSLALSLSVQGARSKAERTDSTLFETVLRVLSSCLKSEPPMTEITASLIPQAAL